MIDQSLFDASGTRCERSPCMCAVDTQTKKIEIALIAAGCRCSRKLKETLRLAVEGGMSSDGTAKPERKSKEGRGKRGGNEGREEGETRAWYL